MVWNKLIDMVFEETESGATAVAEKAPVKGQPLMSKGLNGTPVVSSVLNDDMVQAIRKVTFSRNTALTALISASDALVDIIPDPVMRLKAAHKTAGGGRSAKEISDAVAVHLNDVDGEEMKFTQILNTKIKTEVHGLTQKMVMTEKAVEAATAEIQNLQQRIIQLQQQIAENTAKVVTLRSEAETQESDLRRAETEFKAAAAAVRAELNAHKNTILSTLS